jgi:PAS domain S-box-containing protein
MAVDGPSQFQLFDAVSAVVVVLDRDGRIAHWNRAATELTGYAFEEVRGRYLWESVLRPEDVADVKAVFSDLQETARPNQFENYWVTKGGAWRWLAWSSTVTTDDEGRPEFVIATGVDRTDARLSEEKRRVSEAKLEAIVSIAADAIISVDERQRIVLFNSGAEEIFGWSAGEILGEPLTRLIPARFAERHGALVTAFAAEIASARRMAERAPDIVGLRKSGEEFPAEAAISKVVVEGAPLFTVILRDISDRKLVERSLRDAIRARDHLLGTVAHDLRNPLSSIGLQAKLLARGAVSRDSGEPHPAVARIEDEAKRMTRLIDDLLDYSRIEAGGVSLSRVELEPRELIATAVMSVRALAQASGLELEVDVPRELPPLSADRDRLRQVFDNLLGNAIKFSFEGGTVRVAAEADEDYVSFSVSDSGPGVPAEQRSQLFEPFWQANQADRRGAGLGLTICKQIVEAHGGSIDIDPVEEGGSRFTFTLPR